MLLFSVLVTENDFNVNDRDRKKLQCKTTSMRKCIHTLTVSEVDMRV